MAVGSLEDPIGFMSSCHNRGQLAYTGHSTPTRANQGNYKAVSFARTNVPSFAAVPVDQTVWHSSLPQRPPSVGSALQSVANLGPRPISMLRGPTVDGPTVHVRRVRVRMEADGAGKRGPGGRKTPWIVAPQVRYETSSHGTRAPVVPPNRRRVRLDPIRDVCGQASWDNPIEMRNRNRTPRRWYQPCWPMILARWDPVVPYLRYGEDGDTVS